ncbi:hypothetical protein O0I26_05565 [Staphylococcus pseudintermedius]|uniref:hypothetical protein n=1 Tax=Staphylococcus intermedius group TaxID=2815305 RepID=UPI0015C7F686|nr:MULTISPECIES: hypothetical protein [Staphylococcus intermedius group]EHS7175985.1 hypothetical protein [Staphylococcus pseudintermedius]EHT3598776.1 hypothetical protein [Staphylococcus pseudintermedius]EIA5738308.1 hypothetical protein [Staphylococcus pseudintermedius]EIE3637722.1 hypothetical protein [Staphylococcus pseudintermedius]EIO0095544.1 hypothetical protein [Staphylococcus pseudintermedius]
MFKKKKQIDMRPLVTSKINQLRISAMFLKLQCFLLENEISEEDCKVLARMLNAYYED